VGLLGPGVSFLDDGQQVADGLGVLPGTTPGRIGHRFKALAGQVGQLAPNVHRQVTRLPEQIRYAMQYRLFTDERLFWRRKRGFRIREITDFPQFR
jgi:hypothetical protein